MTTQQQSKCRVSLTSTLITFAVIILFSCSHTVLAQQKDGDEPAPATSGSSSTSGRVNFNIIQLMNGEYLEMFGASGSQGILRGHPTIGAIELGSTSAHPLFFSTGGAERMRIMANGFIGIGTNNPGTPLEMYTPAATSYVPNATQAARIRLINSSAPTPNNVFEINLGALDTNGAPSSGVRLVSIMTDHTAGATSGDFAIGLRRQGTLFESARFTSAGNVGIGTSTPAVALDVAQNKAVRVGQAYFSSGGNYVHLANNAWYNGSAWQFPGGVGALYQINGQQQVFYSHNGAGSFVAQLFLQGNGSVGIGTTNPVQRLDVQGGAINASGGLCIAGDCKTAWSQVGGGGGSSQWTTAGANIHYTAGNVAIGTSVAPVAKLHVQGDARITTNLVVDGNIAAKYQDLAEWVPAAEQLARGTVVVLDATKSNQVTSSNTSYDTRVAGVISEQPGITLGEKGDNKVLVATTGRVRVKVDATTGPIEIGDLLVTSDREGFAMKSMPIEIGSARIHRPGTLIGKALERLAGGTGEILVLLSLQ